MVLVVLAGCANDLPPGRPTPESRHFMAASPVVTPRSAPTPREAPAAGIPESAWNA